MKEGFYVTIRRGRRTGYLAGPFPSFAAADAQIPAARVEADKIDPWTHFDAFGVTRVERTAPNARPLPPGVLNDRLGLAL